MESIGTNKETRFTQIINPVKINTHLQWCEFVYSPFGVKKYPLTYVICKTGSVTPENGYDPNETYGPLQTIKHMEILDLY